MLVRTLSIDNNNTVILVTSSECTLTHKTTDTVLTYKTARADGARAGQQTDLTDQQTVLTKTYLSCEGMFHLTDSQTGIFISTQNFFNYEELVSKKAEETDRQTDRKRQTEERNVYQINLKLKTFRHRQPEFCMRLMDIAADVTSSLKFKLNDLTSFSSHIMTLRHMVAVAET